MKPIDLDLDKENELIFKLVIEGSKPASTKSRFLLESDQYSLVFPAESIANGEVSVVIPTLEKVLNEGVYECTLEVLIDDRVFTPIKLNTAFKKSLKVVAESVVRKRTKETTVSVSPNIVVNRVESIKSNPQKEVNVIDENNSNETRERIMTPAEKKLKLISQIAKKHGIALTEQQFKKVAQLYSDTNKR